MNGLIVVNKPSGITSYDVIRFFKRSMYVRDKIGHAGTLDPLASGVLVVCIGSATKLSSVFMGMEKEYIAQLLLGVKTDTDDIDGRIIEKKDPGEISVSAIKKVVESFKGVIQQVPPVVSAIKHKGSPLYKLHRKGETVVPVAKEVHVKSIEVLNVKLPYVDFRVACSKGTYVRSLCRDIGNMLGCGGTQTALKRTRVGDYTTEDSFTLQEIEEKGIDNCLIPVNPKSVKKRSSSKWTKACK